MEFCQTRGKAPPDVKLKRCAKCSTTQHCSRSAFNESSQRSYISRAALLSTPDELAGHSSAKGLDLAIDKPFTRLDRGTWLHDRPEIDLHRLLIDACRMHVQDACVFDGILEADSIHAEAANGLRGFQRFLGRAEAAKGLLPPWWSTEKRTACEKLGMDTSQWCSLHSAVEKGDIIERYGDPRFSMQLRMFMEAVLGRGPGGAKRASTLDTMMKMERGEHTVMSLFDVGAGRATHN